VNGDVIDLSNVLGALTGVTVLNVNNAADALTFLANNSTSGNTLAGIALDSSTGNVYMDVTHDGVADSVIHLAGVSSVTAAAFEIV
jgi:S-layer protein